MYDRHDNLQHLFQDSLVMYKGRPVFVIRVGEDHNTGFLGIDVGLRTLIKGDINDPSFNTKDLKLGNVNLPTAVAAITRKPMRQYQQGLTDRNTIITYYGPRDFNLHLNSYELYNTVMGIFPSVGEACERIEEGAHSVAISRNLFIYKDLRVFEGEVVIGHIKNKELELKKDKGFYKYCLKGVL